MIIKFLYMHSFSNLINLVTNVKMARTPMRQRESIVKAFTNTKNQNSFPDIKMKNNSRLDSNSRNFKRVMEIMKMRANCKSSQSESPPKPVYPYEVNDAEERFTKIKSILKQVESKQKVSRSKRKLSKLTYL